MQRKVSSASPQALFDKASVNVLEVVGVEPADPAIMLVLIAAAIEAAAKVYLLEPFFRFAAAAAFSCVSVRLFGLEVGSVFVELIKSVAGFLDVSTNGCFIEAGFAVLSVEYFSAGGAAAALLFVACVVCVATAAFQACAFPRIFTQDVVCHLNVIDWMVAHQCKVRRGSRIAFEVVEEEAKATPRVDVAEDPQRFDGAREA